MKDAVDVNINNVVKVELTEFGVELMSDYINSIDVEVRGIAQERYTPDSDGFISIQLWKLMNVFGDNMREGANPVFNKCMIRFTDNYLLGNLVSR